ncbi:UNVERIFIED_ORG: hypothetical protein LHK14_00305 [Roseateles sp. XES5]|nr:hypothetical protein [Roseateles sp. XES5]
MIALANPVTVPFFARVPQRANAVLQRAIQRVWRNDLGPQANEFSYNLFCAELQEVDVAGPSFDEFAAWVRDLPPPPADVTRELPVGLTPADADRARAAYDIVLRSVQLQQSMIAAGYSPESTEMENQIVAEALKDWLTLMAIDEGKDMSLPTTPAELALGFLRPSDSEQSAKLLDVFTTFLQRELSLAIVACRVKEGGAA